MVPVEGGAELGHYVEFDMKYKPQGMKARTSRGRRLKLREGAPFDAELVGMKVDETKKFDLVAPADDEDRHVAGKPVRHEVTILAVRAVAAPGLNDEFAKDTGRYDSLGALRAGVRRELEEGAEAEAASRLQGDLLDRLLDAAPFEVPASMVNLQLDDYCRELADRMDQTGLGHRSADWRAYRQRRLNDAQRAVRSGYLLQALGNADGIQVQDEEIDAEIRKWMADSGATDTFETIKADFDRHGATMEIRGRLRTEKIFAAMLGRMEVAEETLGPAAYEELLEVERRRAEGLAQARFDAGGIGGGDDDDGDGGGEGPGGRRTDGAEDADGAENADGAERTAP
jgi:trigger factor